MDTAAGFTEKRLFKRQRTLKGGRIVFNRSMSTVTCTMRNHSDGGARLDVTSVLGIPDALISSSMAIRAVRLWSCGASPSRSAWSSPRSDATPLSQMPSIVQPN